MSVGTKICSDCKVDKPVTEFYKNRAKKDGMHNICKECDKRRSDSYKLTKKGVTSAIYGDQTKNSKQRGHPLPTYTLQELRDWMYSQKVFHELFDNWRASGFQSSIKPSCDRLNDYKPYTLGNLQIITWHDNMLKAHRDRVNGVNNKANRAVGGVHMKTGNRVEFHSMREAGRVLGISFGNISDCVNHRRKSAAGYKLEYALKN